MNRRTPVLSSGCEAQSNALQTLCALLCKHSLHCMLLHRHAAESPPP